MTKRDPDAEEPKKDEKELLREVLDWMPADVLHDEADPEEAELLASIDARMDRTIRERRDAAAEEEEAAEEEPLADLSQADGTSTSQSTTLEEASEEEAQEEPEDVVRTVRIESEEGGRDPEGARGPREITVRVESVEPDEGDQEALADLGEAATSTSTTSQDTTLEEGSEEAQREIAMAREALRGAPPGDGNGDGNGGDGPGSRDDLTPFTVVAAPLGGIEGDWIVPGEEKLTAGEVSSLSTDLSTDLAFSDIEEEDESLEDIFKDEIAEAEGEALAEAEPEQDLLEEDSEDAEELEPPDEDWEEDEDEFWENLLEEDEDEEIPAFEPEEDWEEAEEGAPDEDLFDDIWQSEDAAEPAQAGAAELDQPEPEEEELAFEEVEFTTVEPEPSEPEEEELAFEEVEFTVADTQVQAPSTEAEDPFGDVHPVIDVEGIGETYAEALEALGIEDTRQLWHADADEVAGELDVPVRTVGQWQAMAELIAISGIGPQYAELLVRSGVTSIEELAQAAPEAMLADVQAKQDELDIRIQGNVVKIGRVTGWINDAREHLGLDPIEAPQAEAELEWPEVAEEPAVEEEAEAPVEGAGEGEGYTHGPYTLYHKVVETGDGDTRDLYFFARAAPEDASASPLPDGYEVGVNERTGVPFVRRERD